MYLERVDQSESKKKVGLGNDDLNGPFLELAVGRSQQFSLSILYRNIFEIDKRHKKNPNFFPITSTVPVKIAMML